MSRVVESSEYLARLPSHCIHPRWPRLAASAVVRQARVDLVTQARKQSMPTIVCIGLNFAGTQRTGFTLIETKQNRGIIIT